MLKYELGHPGEIIKISDHHARSDVGTHCDRLGDECEVTLKTKWSVCREMCCEGRGARLHMCVPWETTEMQKKKRSWGLTDLRNNVALRLG